MSATPGNDLPGAFPTDNVPSSEHTHQPNKLHKRNDPRGWSNNETVPRTDTGSGLASSHARDASLSAQSGDYTYGSQAEPGTETTSRQAGPVGEHRIHNQGQPTSTETTGQPSTEDSVTTIKRDDTTSSAAGLAAGSGTSSALGSDNKKSASTGDESATGAGHNVVRSGLGNKSDLGNQEPYWGDIPRGAGTYNTVVGHGSAEDEVEGHPQHREFPLSGGAHSHGTHGTTTGTSSTGTAHQDSSLTSGQPAAGQGTYNTVVGHGSQEDPAQAGYVGPKTTTTDSEHRDSHAKELAAGAGAAGLGGYAAHKYASREDDSTAPTKTSSHDDKEHKHGGLFHREHKDEPAKHEKVRHEKEKHQKEHREKHEKEHKDDGDKKLFGVFSRHKKDNEHGEPSATATDSARQAQDTTTVNPPSSAAHDDNDRHLGRDAALVGAGAAGAGYAGHKYAHRDDERDGKRSSHDDNLGRKESHTSESKLHGIFHRSNKERETPPNAAEYYNNKEATQIAADKERKGKASPNDRHLYGESSTGPSTVPGATDQHSSSDARDRHGYAAMGATGAVVAPTAYAAHKEHEKHGHSQQTPSGTTGAYSSTTQPSSREQGGQYDHLSSGTPSGVVSGTQTGAYSGDNRSSQPAGAAGRSDPYDHLSSGTASGVALGAGAGALGGAALSGNKSSQSTGASGRSDPYDHLSSGTASGIATGAGAGALGGATTGENRSARAAGSTGGNDPYDHLASGTASGVKAGHQDPSNTMASPSSSAYSTDDKPSHGSSKLAYTGAGAAGAGAAAYGAHKYFDRDNSTTQPSSTDAYTRTTESSATNPVSSTQRSADMPAGSADRHQSAASNTAAALGVGAPVSAYGARRAQEHGVHSSDPDAGVSSSRGNDLSRSSQDSSKAGQYNVLSSGTPSGVNLEQMQSHSGSHQDSSQQRSANVNDPLSSSQQRSANVHDPLTSSSSQGADHSKLAAAGGAAALAGAGAAGYASTRGQDSNTNTSSYDNVISNAPERQAASGTTDTDIHGRNLMSGNQRQIDTSTDPNAGSASYDNKPTAPQHDYSSSATSGGALAGGGVASGAAAMAAARAATRGDGGSSGLSKPVMHTCTECGKQNDISSYFSSAKDLARH